LGSVHVIPSKEFGRTPEHPLGLPPNVLPMLLLLPLPTLVSLFLTPDLTELASEVLEGRFGLGADVLPVQTEETTPQLFPRVLVIPGIYEVELILPKSPSNSPSPRDEFPIEVDPKEDEVLKARKSRVSAVPQLEIESVGRPCLVRETVVYVVGSSQMTVLREALGDIVGLSKGLLYLLRGVLRRVAFHGSRCGLLRLRVNPSPSPLTPILDVHDRETAYQHQPKNRNGNVSNRNGRRLTLNLILYLYPTHPKLAKQIMEVLHSDGHREARAAIRDSLPGGSYRHLLRRVFQGEAKQIPRHLPKEGPGEKNEPAALPH